MGKLKDAAKAFFELFTPGGTIRTKGGFRLRVSANGTTSIDPRDLHSYVLSALDEHRPRPQKPDNPPTEGIVEQEGGGRETAPAEKRVNLDFKL